MFPAPKIVGLPGCYVPEHALALALASRAAYSKAAEAEKIARRSGAIDFRWIESEDTDTQAFIAENETEIVIAFRGTEAVRDWITDAKFRREGWTHRGFNAALRSVRDDLFLILPHRKRVWITGHSLGGALAMLFAIDLFAPDNIAGVYTFGQPRVGSRAWAKRYDLGLGQKTFRVVNEQDLVTRLPGVLIGYRHAGTEIFLDSFGEVHENPSWYSKIPSDICGLAAELDIVTPITSVLKTPLKNHGINRYIEKLHAI